MNKIREEAVWKRVMAASEEMPDCGCNPTVKPDRCLSPCQIMELLEHELEDACTYRTLASRVKKDIRQILLQLARDEQCHYRRLEAVYYLMTGKRPCPDRPKAPCVACTNEELRKRYEAEVEGARHYHCLAEKAGSFAGVFHCLGRDEDRHARMILHLLERCL